MTGGRVQKGYQNVILTTNALKLHLGIPLTDEEERAEQMLAGVVGK